MGFSGIEQKVLEIFTTSATDHIYALRHNIPPEVFGSFGSFFSRNPKDFRGHILDAICGRIKGYETDAGGENLVWLAQGDFREPVEALRSGIAKSQDFFREWYGRYSHKSIANTVWIPMVANNVSQLFARELAYDQLAFFIEQSTRFVKFDAGNMFHDPTIMASSNSDDYEEALRVLSSSYQELTDIAIGFYQEKIPFNSWLKMQDERTLKSSDRAKQLKYNREIMGKALDVSRFILPQAIRTNIAWILDARSTEFDISAWKGHPLQEIRDSGLLIERHAGQIAPSLLKYTEPSKYYAEKLNGYNGFLASEPPRPFEKGVEIISYEQDGLNKVIAHLLKRHNRGGTFAQRLEETERMDFKKKIGILNRITQDRIITLGNGKKYTNEWVETDEDFDLVKLTLEIRTDLGAVRDWRRHQKFDRGEPLYTLDNGFQKPPMIKDMHSNAGKIFDKAMSVAHNAERKIRAGFPYQAQYIVPMAAMHSLTMSGGLDQVQYAIYTRSTPEGNWSYRQDAFNLAEALVKLYPWLLGFKEYPEGEDFKEVYQEAPLKKIIILQAEETGIHQ